MFEGYLELGGNEIINSARTVGYLNSGECPSNWIVCAPCDGIQDALGHDDYNATNITQAPWYDEQEEASHRFYGVHALSVDGLSDSTRTATISEGITDGGVVGQVRHAVRQTRYRALLSAVGEDALESGLAWLKAALDPDFCGTHGSSCGASDSCFFTACPPTRDTIVTKVVEWDPDPVVNLVTNPSFERAASASTAGQAFSKPTGAAGQLRIVDTGMAVEFWIACSDSATNIASLAWSGFVNGAAVNGNVNLPAGFVQKMVASYPVTASQTVQFSIPATGTSGLGGPTNHSALIIRNPILFTNLATNPSFESPGAVQVLATNLLTNPSLEAVAGVPVELRRNIVQNPRCLTTAWWTTGGGFTGTLVATPQGFQIDAPAGFSGPYLLHPAEWVPTIPNAWYVGSFEVTVPAGFPAVTLYATMQSDSDAGASGDDVTIYPNQTIRVSSNPGTASPTGNNRIILNSRSMPAGARIFVRNVIFEQGTAKSTDYFDGGTTNTGDFTHLWVGTPDASSSTQNVLPVTGVTVGRAAQVFSSKAWASNRTRSVRVRQAEQNNSDSFANLGGGAGTGMNFGVQAGKTYTFKGKLRLTAPQHVNFNAARARGVSIFFNGGASEVNSVPTPNTAGVHDFSLTFTVPAGTTEAFFRLYNGGWAAGEEVWFDDLMLVEGNYSGPYFDGATVAGTTLRRNRFVNPSLRGTGNDLWSPMGDAVLTPTADGLQADWSDGNFALYGSFMLNNSYDFVTGSAEFYVPPGFPALTLTLVDEIRDGDGNNVASATSGPIVIQPGEAKRVGTSAMMPMTNPKTTRQRWIISATGTGANRVIMRDLLYETGVAGPYFDGSRPAPGGYASAWVGAANASESTLSLPGFTYAWTGTPDASTSTKSGMGVAGVPVPIGAAASQGSDSPAQGTKFLRFTVDATTGVVLGLTTAVPTQGQTYTLLGKVRPRTRDQVFTPQIRSTHGAAFTAPKDVWTEFRATVVAGAGADYDTGLFIQSGSGHQVGDLIDVDAVVLVAGYYTGPYFDGSTADSAFAYDWTGAANASTSVVSAPDVADVTAPVPGTMVRWQDTESPASGSKIVRYQTTAVGDLYFPIAAYGHTTGDTFTIYGRVRPKTRTTTFAVAVRGTKSITFVAPMGVWTEFQAEVIAGSGAANTSGLFALGGATQPGDVIDIDTVLETLGAYAENYFDGDTADQPEDADATLPIGTRLERYSWTGTAHASTSTRETGQVLSAPDPVGYEAALDTLHRTMHDVTCISGPLIEQKFHRGSMWGYIVEFTLAAGTPWLFGKTRSIVIPPGFPVVIQDVPFNLVPYPSAELASGTVVAAKNFSTNPSVETNVTGWASVQDGTKILAAQLGISRSNELAAAGGGFSAKVLFTANTTNSAGWFGAGQTVALPGITPTTRYSINLWAVASVQSGTAVLGNIDYVVYWQDAAGTTLRVDPLGSLAASGGAISKRSILPPAGTTKAFVHARINVTSWSSGALIRLYADALAVTVP